MAVYQYKSRSQEGTIVKGLVEAPNDAAATKLLHEKNLFVITLSVKQQSFSIASIIPSAKRVKFGDIVNFTRQLSTMVVAGLSLPESLTILRTQTPNPLFMDVLMDIEHQIIGGGNLADALGQYPQYFTPIYRALIHAGESSGTLDVVLSRLAESMESQREFRSKVVGAMIYPLIIVIGMIVVVAIMMIVVVPKLTELYTDLGVDLPGSTKFLMGMSGFFVHFWWFMIILAGAGVWAFQKWRQTPVGQMAIDSFILKIPLFGELQKKVILVDFTRTFAMLTASGIHILDGLKILKDALGNVLFQKSITNVIKKVEKGFPLGESFGKEEVFPIIVSQMMKVGEETGKLDDTMSKLAVYFQSESEHLVKGLTTAIEPIIMVVLGVGVGFIVISVITPIYNLTSQFK